MSQAPQLAPSRVRGLDTIRFFLAFWVVLYHARVVPLPESWTAGRWGLVLRGVANNTFVGPAAVIVFFVISGFCIHYPHRQDSRIDLLPFFVRRHIRIWLPVLAAIAIGQLVGLRFEGFRHSILWSLVCEEIYYTLYPLFLRARRRLGWRAILGGSFALAYATVLTDDGGEGGNYAVYHGYLTWLLGYPCWLLGAWLAERCDAFLNAPAPSRRSVWMWRLGAVVLGSVLSVLRFHSPLTYPWTLNLIALYSVGWLRVEVQAGAQRGPPPFERLGLASYTIYLTHMVGQQVGTFLGLKTNGAVGWVGTMAVVGVVAIAFYFLVENPSYVLARWWGRLLLQRTKRAQAARQGVQQRMPTLDP